MHIQFSNRKQIFLLNPKRKDPELKSYQFFNIHGNSNQEQHSNRITRYGSNTPEMCNSSIFNVSSQVDQDMIVK